MAVPELPNLSIQVADKVAHIKIDRPEKANSLHMPLWEGFLEAFAWADESPDVRVVVLSGEGKHFCAGIDLELFATLGVDPNGDVAKQGEKLRKFILKLQDCLTAMERCSKPVICAIHGACVGGGVDLIAAADMRYACTNARFSIKEIDLGMAADVGTLQRLPYWIPAGVMRELAFTGRDFFAEEAKAIGLVNAVYDDQAGLMAGVNEIAAAIATKSPTAIRAIKDNLLYARDHSVADSLHYIATWNASQLMTKDVQEALSARFENREASFSDE